MIALPEESKCRVTAKILCDFRVTGDYPDAQVEVCNFCGRKVIYNKSRGRIDNKLYLRQHFRDFVQPYGEMRDLYRRLYGLDSVIARERTKAERARKPKIQDIQREMRERMRSHGRTTTLFSK